jgi:hypothetical protein
MHVIRLAQRWADLSRRYYVLRKYTFCHFALSRIFSDIRFGAAFKGLPLRSLGRAFMGCSSRIVECAAQDRAGGETTGLERAPG